MGNALSGDPHTKHQRLELVRAKLEHEKKQVKRKVNSCMIKIGFLHSQIKHLYDQQANTTNPASTWVTENRIQDIAISITHAQRDKESLQECVEQIECMIEAVHAMITSTNTRDILARTGRALYRASQSHAEALQAHALASQHVESQEQDIAHIDNELQRANLVLEHTNKVLADVSTRNKDQRALARQDCETNDAARTIIGQYDKMYRQQYLQKDMQIQEAVSVITQQRATVV
jgi:hypothetical protein